VDAVDFVILGSGDPALEQRFAALAVDPRRAATGIGLVAVSAYARRLSNWIYAGADVLLVPSDYEPSGLTQMIALRYGAVPLVRLTGGLADTVVERGAQTGFVFEGLGRTFATPDEDLRRRAENARQLHEALGRACGVYFDQPARWARIVLEGMRQDNDWSRSLPDYLGVYRRVTSELRTGARRPL
jgi:starch synthase